MFNNYKNSCLLGFSINLQIAFPLTAVSSFYSSVKNLLHLKLYIYSLY